MKYYAYLFELKGIQPFLFATGKLRDMVAGSELIDFLCTSPLDEVLALATDTSVDKLSWQNSQYSLSFTSAQQEQHVIFCPRKAGGAFYFVFDNADIRQRFAVCWRLLVNQVLPNTEQVEVMSEGQTTIKSALKQGFEQLAASRTKLPSLPFASPLTLRSPRTGYAAVGKDKKDNEWLDMGTRNKRKFERPYVQRESIIEKALTERFSDAPELKWPNTFEEDGNGILFPLNNHNIAIIHADGNGLGEVLRVLNEATANADDETYIKLYRQFSDELAVATIESARTATNMVVLPLKELDIVPLRPVVLGGDDLTVIIREDLAFEFARIFCEQFEEHSSHMLHRLKSAMLTGGIAQQHVGKLPGLLTACAGISFIKPSQPFAQAYELTEELCKRAKKQSRQHKKTSDIPSSIAFIRLQDSLIESLELVDKRERIVSLPEGILSLGLDAYGVGSVPSTLPTLDNLYKLQSLFTHSSDNALNGSRLRGFFTLLHQDVNSAMRDYLRWLEVSPKQHIANFPKILAEVLGVDSVDSQYPFAHKASDGSFISPLADLLCVLFSAKPAQGERDA